MKCCTARQVRLKKINTARATAKANAAVKRAQKSGVQPKKTAAKKTPAKKTNPCKVC
jgi:hypothetical protein